MEFLLTGSTVSYSLLSTFTGVHHHIRFYNQIMTQFCNRMSHFNLGLYSQSVTLWVLEWRLYLFWSLCGLCLAVLAMEAGKAVMDVLAVLAVEAPAGCGGCSMLCWLWFWFNHYGCSGPCASCVGHGGW